MGSPALADQEQDRWLQAKLVTIYSLNSQLNPFAIEVDVQQSVVTLAGVVESEVERELAEVLAKSIEGIEAVNNQLRVDPDVERNDQRGDFARTVQDANITAMIKSQLAWNTATRVLDLQVTTKNAVVTLAGVVNNEQQAQQAKRIADNTVGVKSVVSDLNIRTTPSADRPVAQTEVLVRDITIHNRIVTLLKFDRRFIGSAVAVETRRGKVILRGTAVSSEQRANIIQMARDVLGVREVESEIEVITYA